MREIRMHGSVRGIEVCFMVRYCGTFDTERQKKQRKQILPKKHDYIMSTRPKPAFGRKSEILSPKSETDRMEAE